MAVVATAATAAAAIVVVGSMDLHELAPDSAAAADDPLLSPEQCWYAGGGNIGGETADNDDDDVSGGDISIMSIVDGDQPSPAPTLRPYQVIIGGLQDVNVAVADGGDACNGLKAEPELPGGDNDESRIAAPATAPPGATIVAGYATVGWYVRSTI